MADCRRNKDSDTKKGTKYKLSNYKQSSHGEKQKKCGKYQSDSSNSSDSDSEIPL